MKIKDLFELTGCFHFVLQPIPPVQQLQESVLWRVEREMSDSSSIKKRSVDGIADQLGEKRSVRKER